MTCLDGKSILIIDDDPAMLRALNRVLSGEGAAVATASWAGDAMTRLGERMEHFDVIITDLRMPLVGGQAILAAATVALPEVPVIIITAFGNPELKTACLERGAAAFLEKPLDSVQLIAAVNRALSWQRPEDQQGTEVGHPQGATNCSSAQAPIDPPRQANGVTFHAGKLNKKKHEPRN